jgi:hypothetical protein
VKNYIAHPVDPTRKLYFLADVPHLLKNLRASLVNKSKLHLPEKFFNERNISNKEITIEPLEELIKHQEDQELKLAPNLRPRIVDPSHFQKMNVGEALSFFSHSSSSALKYRALESSSRGSLALAAFIDVIRSWFDLMTSRNRSMALSYSNKIKHGQAVTFLKDFISMVNDLNVEANGKMMWKPWQAGMIISTTSIIQLQEELLDLGFTFILTSRFTQDALENLFSLLRDKSPTPTAIEVKNNLRIIVLCQFMKEKSASNYQFDDSEYLLDFIEELKEEKKNSKKTEDATDEQFLRFLTYDLTNFDFIDHEQVDILFYIYGYILADIKKRYKFCKNCIR